MELEIKSNPQFLELDLISISKSHTLRCDAKNGEHRFRDFDQLIHNNKYIELGEFLNTTIVKGVQPTYLEEIGASGVPVINTLSIQNLKINIEDCRYISDEDFEILDDTRKLKLNDVLLTVDGGTSIGKPVLFQLEGDYTIDSHVAILRPVGISPLALVYLLASPLGQLQFNKAESGASGQTAVTEDDIRRFKFPISDLRKLESEAQKMDAYRNEIEKKKKELDQQLINYWKEFGDNLSNVKKSIKNEDYSSTLL